MRRSVPAVGLWVEGLLGGEGVDVTCVRPVVLSHNRSQFLRRLEHRYWTRGHFDGVPGPRVPRHPGFSVSNFEGTEPTNLNVVLGGQRVLHSFKERINYPSAVFF